MSMMLDTFCIELGQTHSSNNINRCIAAAVAVVEDHVRYVHVLLCMAKSSIKKENIDKTSGHTLAHEITLIQRSDRNVLLQHAAS